MTAILKGIRIFGLILVIIGCIIAIPIAALCVVGMIFMYPGLRMWQFSDEKLDERDADGPITVEVGQHPCEYKPSAPSCKCAK